MNGAHDASVCVARGRYARGDTRTHREALTLFRAVASTWLRRPRGEFGRTGREAANILHAAACMRLAPSDEVLLLLLLEAVEFALSFNEQNAANCLWSAARLGVSDAHIVVPLALACVRLLPSFNAQGAANSL